MLSMSKAASCRYKKQCLIILFFAVALIFILLLQNSLHQIPVRFLLSTTDYRRDYINTSADPELLFAGFNNETGVEDDIIPDIVHFVMFGQAGYLDFTSFLCVLAAIKVHRPATLYLHSDSPLYAGNNSDNRYWLILKNTSASLNVSLEARHLPRPTHVYGQRLSSVWHAADVARINLLRQFGGMTLDRDLLILKPLHQFRHFEMALGWPERQFIGTQVLIAHPMARLLQPWLEGYRHYRPSMWYYNAAQLPTQTFLLSRPEIVHRERWKFGVQNLVKKLYGLTPWSEWHEYFCVHLLSRHRYLLSDRERAPIPENSDKLDEFLVQKYEAPFGEMARYVLHRAPPRLPPPSLWPGKLQAGN